ncbi:hypothetical protein WJX72_001925 [[Myrmecia] bisecta]|uniref:Hexosyltransferase n=1 Tax=[Myrmecia] bisecta TaxID=41462 RepID=A0AAW1R642_9CHLO
MQSAADGARPRRLAVVGVQTGFSPAGTDGQYNYQQRRAALRQTWFPASQRALDRFEADSSIVIRFVIGHSDNAAMEADIMKEERLYGGFWRLPLQEGYSGLTAKTLMFLTAAARRYNARYIVKVDDDVYLRVARLPPAVQQWTQDGAEYVGCMKTGDIVTSPEWRWFEPQHQMLGSKSYFTHAWGSIYVVSGAVAEDLASRRPGSLRQFTNEDVTLGSWMLAMNITFRDERRLCENDCTATSIAVYDMPKCAGLCNPAEQLVRLHTSEACQAPPLDPATNTLPELPPIFQFSKG